MSGCCCCEGPFKELLEGSRRKEILLKEEEQREGGGGAGEEERGMTMDISLLRAQYRSSRDQRSRQTQVLLFRTVSEDLTEAVRVVPITQGLTPPNITFDPSPITYDPWHLHLDAHRRSRTFVPVQLPVFSSETNTNHQSVSISSRQASSSFEACSFKQESSSRKLSSTPESLSSSRELSSCRLSSTKLEDHISVDGSSGDPAFEQSTGVCFIRSKVDPVQICLTDSLIPSELSSIECIVDDCLSSSKEDHVYSSFINQDSLAPGSQSSSDESSTPVASITGSPSSSSTNLHEALNEAWSSDTKSSSMFLQPSGSPTGRRPRRFWSPANRFSRLSVGRAGSVTGVQEDQNYYPFPRRKTPRISEAARRLGMYSSF
ncbi:uncharacterized protein LOC129603926 isoform X2 [Betta splendens]|uniref:Uncharacterized protein LOC129603926 isoform X2 n=1 Tax=Betta splendens TaxID=158456 RepID=A0A9W2XPX4_BETSP|nr:uncharacterized protein LOC129603926 isoform X2 [Betta splendens]